MLLSRRQGRPLALESLESREAPVGLFTSVSFPSISEAFSFNPLAFQQETVLVQVSSPGTTVTSGQVTINDGGQSQVASVNSNGQASATFNFNILQGLWAPHTVSASFNDPTGIYTSSSASTQTPDATNQALPFLLVDVLAFYYIAASLSAAAASAGG